MPELVYPPVIAALRTAFRVLDLRITLSGTEHVPTSGAAVLASNHVSYLDFVFCGLAARPSKRLVRFLAKQEIFAHRIGGPLMRGMRHIPVDRDAGMASYKASLEALRRGEVLGVFPEATISTSFVVKEFKSGSVRMAAVSNAPLVPVAVWGTQRLWTKGRKRSLWTRHVPISILVGEPMHPARRDDHAAVTAELHRRISALVDKAQREYPDQPSGPDDRWWLPAHLGGTAPEPAAEPAREAEPPTGKPTVA
jgi:1-acyl-sn-glycerol-3-phosphate acyltransferase